MTGPARDGAERGLRASATALGVAAAVVAAAGALALAAVAAAGPDPRPALVRGLGLADLSLDPAGRPPRPEPFPGFDPRFAPGEPAAFPTR